MAEAKAIIELIRGRFNGGVDTALTDGLPGTEWIEVYYNPPKGTHLILEMHPDREDVTIIDGSRDRPASVDQALAFIAAR